MMGNSYSHTTRRCGDKNFEMCSRKSEIIAKRERSPMRKHYGGLGAERLSRLLNWHLMSRESFF